MTAGTSEHSRYGHIVSVQIDVAMTIRSADAQRRQEENSVSNPNPPLEQWRIETRAIHAGENRSEDWRIGLIVHYSLAWLRQEENQYLTTPEHVLKQLPEDLLRLMGYSRGAYSLGFIDGGRDPIAAIRPELERETGPVPELKLRSGEET